jgi:hypothetical protein
MHDGSAGVSGDSDYNSTSGRTPSQHVRDVAERRHSRHDNAIAKSQ